MVNNIEPITYSNIPSAEELLAAGQQVGRGFKNPDGVVAPGAISIATELNQLFANLPVEFSSTVKLGRGLMAAMSDSLRGVGSMSAKTLQLADDYEIQAATITVNPTGIFPESSYPHERVGLAEVSFARHNLAHDTSSLFLGVTPNTLVADGRMTIVARNRALMGEDLKHAQEGSTDELTLPFVEIRHTKSTHLEVQDAAMETFSKIVRGAVEHTLELQ